MNRRHLLKSFAIALFAGAVSSAAPAIAGSGAAAMDAAPVLRVGKSHRYADDLRITFVKVKHDHRCPINARCVSAGDAKAILRVKIAGRPAHDYPLHTDRKPKVLILPAYDDAPGTISLPKTYYISIKELSPLPYAGRKTPQRAFRLKLDIAVAI